ncbi:hypothetical protein COO60DRAFT_950246 [Scenedesmus sp. NREL 46B-D3]|nr:hypothetical protein COO60DRAFT_950246 [Scenedesmus sp. NREL 46B-D3]
MQWVSAVDAGETSMDGVSSSSSSSSSRSSSSSAQQQQAGQLQGALRGSSLSHLTAQDWVSLLHTLLPKPRQKGSSTPAAVTREHQEAADRCRMADLLWRCLQENCPASEAAVRQLLEASCSWQLLGEDMSSVFLQRGLASFKEAHWVQGRPAAPAGTAHQADATAAAAQQQLNGPPAAAAAVHSWDGVGKARCRNGREAAAAAAAAAGAAEAEEAAAWERAQQVIQAAPHSCIHNSLCALELGDQLCVPVLTLQMHRARHSSSMPPTAVVNLMRHLKIMQYATNQQQQQQQQQQQGMPQPCHDPALLWQLSLLKVCEVYPEPDILADVEPASYIRRAMEDCITVQDLPDARVQMLAEALAGAKHVPVGGVAAGSAMAALAAGELGWQKRKLGSMLADSAVQRLRPQLLQWVVQQQGLWEEGVHADDPHMCDAPFVVGPEDAPQQLAQSEQLQQASLSRCCPLTVGLQQRTAAAAAAAAELTGGVGSVGTAGELAACADTAMVLLQLQPPLHTTLLSSWISDNLRAGSSSSSSSSSGGDASLRAARIGRARAVLSAVAAAAELPAGAQHMTKKALQKAVGVGDADVLALLLLWSSRCEAWDADETEDAEMGE